MAIFAGCADGRAISVPSDTESIEKSSLISENASLSSISSESTSTVSFTNNELLEQLKEGDVSGLKLEGESPDLEFFNNICNDPQNEWVQYDINRDGFDDLILQEKRTVGKQRKRIIAIFSAHDSEMTCKLLDVSDVTEFFFLADNNNLIYYYDEHYTHDVYIYRYIELDCEWNRQWIYDLHIYKVIDFDEINSEWWKEHRSDITEKGIYTYKLVPHNTEDSDGSCDEIRLSKQQFLGIFRETTGVDFEEMEPKLFLAWSNK